MVTYGRECVIDFGDGCGVAGVVGMVVTVARLECLDLLS